MQDELMVTPQELKNTAGSFEQSSRTAADTRMDFEVLPAAILKT